jgi:hypothetical protein
MEEELCPREEASGFDMKLPFVLAGSMKPETVNGG